MSTVPDVTKADLAKREDFYFKCETLGCVLRASACERNRTESSRSVSMMLTKQSTKCKRCTEHTTQQEQTRISIDDYHRQVLSDASAENLQGKKEVPLDHSLLRSEWRGSGRTLTRV